MRFIFVGGSARSGTSLVQKLLVSHSAVAGGPEFDHTAAIVGLHGRMTKDWRLPRQAFYYDAATLEHIFTSFYSGFFEPVLARKPEARFVSEKTPDNVFVASTLMSWWPDALFINVLRDGRDVVLSHLDIGRRYRERGERNPENDTLLTISRHWNACTDRYLDMSADPAVRDRIHNVRFEKLVSEPEEELRRLFGFIGLPLEERQLHPETITEQETGVAIEGAYFTQDMYRQPFNPSKIQRWRSDMPAWQRLLSTALMRKNLRQLGYR